MQKLSEMWDRADKDLVQIKGNYGEGNQACAVGAIALYACGWQYMPLSPKFNIEILDAINKFQERYGTIAFLNDDKAWTFKQFAEAARKIGL